MAANPKNMEIISPVSNASLPICQMVNNTDMKDAMLIRVNPTLVIKVTSYCLLVSSNVFYNTINH